MAEDIHSQIVDSNELHVPKGFTEANANQVPSKNSVGDFEWVDTAGFSGPVGPTGPAGSLANIDVVSIDDPATEMASIGFSIGEFVVAIQKIDNLNNEQTSYSYDASNTELVNSPYVLNTLEGGNTRWVAVGGKYTELGVMDSEGSRLITQPEVHSIGINSSTGIHSGGIVSINADNTKYDISQGDGLIVDSYSDPENVVSSEVSWTGVVAKTPDFLLTNAVSYIAMGKGAFNPVTKKYDGVIVEQATPFTREQSREIIFIGILTHTTNTDIQAATVSVKFTPAPYNQFSDLAEVIGQINVSGNIFSANGTNLNLNKSAGETYRTGVNYENNKKDPDVIANLANTPAMWFYNYRALSGDNIVLPGNTLVDPRYDDGSGTLQVVPNNSFSTQRIYFAAEGSIIIAYGQQVYTSIAAAEADINGSFEKDPRLVEIPLRGWLIVKGNATDLSNPTQAKFINGGKFGETSSSGASSSTTTQQQAYNNSTPNPEIETSDVGGAMTFRRGSTNESDDVIEVQNQAGAQKFSVTGEGETKINGQAYSLEKTLVDAANISVDATLGNVFKVTLNGNRELDNPTNLKAGATYIIRIIQDGTTGGRTLTYGTAYKFLGGETPTLTTAINSVDILTGVSDGTNLYCSMGNDFK
jgi:hypothetical protein